MLGGAAVGTFARLDSTDNVSDEWFQAFYQPLREMVLLTGLDGLDLDVEEEMSLSGIVGLIDALRADFGEEFLITLAPVAAAMEYRNGEVLAKRTNLSGFDYFELEEVFGENVDWYNVQFYCGWGDASSSAQYERVVAKGWPPEKLVFGLSTNESSAPGWVPDDIIRETLLAIKAKFGDRFGGVMGWEYWNSVSSVNPFGEHASWVKLMSDILRPATSRSTAQTPIDQDQATLL